MLTAAFPLFSASLWVSGKVPLSFAHFTRGARTLQPQTEMLCPGCCLLGAVSNLTSLRGPRPRRARQLPPTPDLLNSPLCFRADDGWGSCASSGARSSLLRQDRLARCHIPDRDHPGLTCARGPVLTFSCGHGLGALGTWLTLSSSQPPHLRAVHLLTWERVILVMRPVLCSCPLWAHVQENLGWEV